MKPLNKKFFGPEEGKIAIQFHDGVEVVSGYIIEQLGVRRFLVSDGDVEKVCTLAPTTEIAEDLTDNYCTIVVDTADGLKFATSIKGKQIITTEGDTVMWRRDATTGDSGSIVVIEAEEESPYESLFDLDFAEGTYTLAGNAIDLEDVIASTSFAGAEAATEDNFVEGVGFVVDGVADFNTNAIFALAPALASTLTDGYVVVLTMKMETDTAVDEEPNIYIRLMGSTGGDDGPFGMYNVALTQTFGPYGNQATAYDSNGTLTLYGNTGDGYPVKVAARIPGPGMTPDTLTASAMGEDLQQLTDPEYDIYELIVEYLLFVGCGPLISGSAQAIIERATFYAYDAFPGVELESASTI